MALLKGLHRLSRSPQSIPHIPFVVCEFSGEDGMEEDPGQRLRYGGLNEPVEAVMQPLQG